MKTHKEKKSNKKGRFKKIKVLVIAELILVVLLIVGTSAFFTQQDGWIYNIINLDKPTMNQNPVSKNNENEIHAAETDQLEKQRLENIHRQEIAAILEKAHKKSLGYDYNKAIKIIKNYKNYNQETELVDAIDHYTKEKDKLVPYEGEVSHVFFHSLIADNSKAFDNDGMSNGYNYWMTTVSEFQKMLDELYNRGFVLVSIHDVAGEVKEDGKTSRKEKIIKLPPGKIPFVLSQDDVNYYEYMKTDGFASKLIIDEEGHSANEININGKTVIGRDYDVVPILDTFIEEHPDFSYKGAKGIIAVTGYEGALGYRTNDSSSKTYEEDKKQVKKVAEALKKKGWEFASHSYGHPHMKDYPLDKFKRDSSKWKEQVESLVGKTDIYIYPFGEEIDYKGEKYDYLNSLGFQYFCGVYAKPWIQVTEDYVRMTRRNLDGFTMHFYPERLTDLFDVGTVMDKERPEFK